MAPAKVDVFAFRDYRAFLRAYYENGRKQGAAVSLRAFGRRAGLRSPNYLKLVMDGERNLTPEMAQRFAEAAGLEGEAAAYFCDLVAFNQAKSARERERAYDRVSRHRGFRKVHKLSTAQDAYHSKWFLPAIRELAARKDFQEDPAWVARSLLPRISTRDARAALSKLQKLGLLIREETGRLVQAEPLLETRDGPLSHHVISFHRAMLERAAESMERVPREEREIASLTLCLSETRMLELKQHLERVRADILQRYTSDEEATRVVQVNLQLFPLSAKEPRVAESSVRNAPRTKAEER